MEAAPPLDARPRIGEWMSRAFNLFAQEWVVWTVQGTLFTLILGPLLAGLIGIYVVKIYGVFAGVFSGKLADNVAQAELNRALGIVGGGSVVIGLVSALLLTGMMRTAERQLAGEPIGVGDMFRVGDAFARALGVAVLSSLGIGVGSLFCVVPGLWLAGRWLLAHPLASEERKGVLAALGESWRLTRADQWLWVVWALLVYLVAGAGGLLVIGGIVTVPLAVLMLMVGFREVVRE